MGARRYRDMLGVDGRMLFNSGIGTVLQNVLKGLSGEPGRVLVNSERTFAWCEEHLPSWEIVHGTSSIYSLKEQIEVPRKLAGCSRIWIPHYNIPLLAESPIVATVHDVLHIARPEMFPGAARQAYARILLFGLVRRASRVVCVSRFTADELVRLTGCKRSKIEVVYNGVSPDWFHATPPVALTRGYFVYVGNVKPHKNLLRLLKAFSMVKDRIPEDLVIVGKKDGFITGDNRVEPFAAELGDRVRFSGLVSDEDLRALVAGSRGMVFPSLYEGFGLPPLEAMAAGVPVAVSRVASLPEVCGDAALYFDPVREEEIASSLISLSTMPDEARAELIAKSRQRAAEFSWDASVGRMRDILMK